MNKSWIYLEPFTLLFLQKEDALIYNSVSYRNRVFKNIGRLGNILSKLLKPENMYCVEISNADFQEKAVEDFIAFIRSSFSGDLLASPIINRPVIFPPFLKQQFLTKEGAGILKRNRENILNLLEDVYFYLGGENPISNLKRIKTHLQFDYSIQSNGKYLPFKEIALLANSLEKYKRLNINILGGNIFTYPDIHLLVTWLNNLEFSSRIYSSYSDFPDEGDLLALLMDANLCFRVLIDFPINQKKLTKTITDIKRRKKPLELLFVVTSIDEYQVANSIIQSNRPENSEIKPVYTGRNINFFKENVYLCEEDIIKAKIDKKESFMRQMVNLHQFGKIRVMVDGKIYSDFFKSSIGTVSTPLVNLLYKEIYNNKGWMRIRDNSPCNQCIYQWLCPSPSGYEDAIGIPNLCTVK